MQTTFSVSRELLPQPHRSIQRCQSRPQLHLPLPPPRLPDPLLTPRRPRVCPRCRRLSAPHPLQPRLATPTPCLSWVALTRLATTSALYVTQTPWSRAKVVILREIVSRVRMVQIVDPASLLLFLSTLTSPPKAPISSAFVSATLRQWPHLTYKISCSFR